MVKVDCSAHHYDHHGTFQEDNNSVVKRLIALSLTVAGQFWHTVAESTAKEDRDYHYRQDEYQCPNETHVEDKVRTLVVQILKVLIDGIIDLK